MYYYNFLKNPIFLAIDLKYAFTHSKERLISMKSYSDLDQKGKKILYVEDEALIAILESKQLKSKNYVVHHVSSGEDAVASIMDDHSNFDLVLMDIDLGEGMDGTKAAEEILRIKDIPILFYSSHTEPEVVNKTESISGYGYLVKNSGIFVLDAAIKMALKLFQTKQERNQAEISMKRAFHELSVHQEELSAQNIELRRVHSELEISKSRYFDLYDLAPLGYLTVGELGQILETNLTAATLLGLTRPELLKMNLTDFVLPADQDIFYLHRKNLFESRIPQSFSLYLIKKDSEKIKATLSTCLSLDESGRTAYRVIISL